MCHLARRCNSRTQPEELAEEGNLTEGEKLREVMVDTSQQLVRQRKLSSGSKESGYSGYIQNSYWLRVINAEDHREEFLSTVLNTTVRYLM